MISPQFSPLSAAAAGGAGGAEPPLPVFDVSERSLQRLAELLKPGPVNVCEASQSVVQPILSKAGLQGQEPQAHAAVPPTPGFSPFSWVGEDSARKTAACERLQQYLAALGVSIGGEEGFKVADVHTFEDALEVTINETRFTGGADAIIIPGKQGEEYAQFRSRVVVNFEVGSNSFREVQWQMVARLMTGTALADQDVLVLVTDLNSFGHLMRAEGQVLRYWKDCSVHFALGLVRDFLVDECFTEVTAFSLESMKGYPATKQARFDFHAAVQRLKPGGAKELIEQLQQFRGGTLEDYIHANALVHTYLGKG